MYPNQFNNRAAQVNSLLPINSLPGGANNFQQPVTLQNYSSPPKFYTQGYNPASDFQSESQIRQALAESNQKKLQLFQPHSAAQQNNFPPSNQSINLALNEIPVTPPATQSSNPFMLLSADTTQTQPSAQEQSQSQPTPTNSETTPTLPQADSKTLSEMLTDLQKTQNKNEQQPEDKIKLRTYPQRGSISEGFLPQLNQQPYLDADSTQALNSLYMAKKIYQNSDDVQQEAAKKLAQKDGQ